MKVSDSIDFITPYYFLLDAPIESDVLEKIERIARVCYKSEGAITDGSAQRLVQRLIDSGHEAMIEHCTVSVLLAVDRGVTHEIVRHRVASYAQESTRYCNYSNDSKFSNGIVYADIIGGIHLDRKMRNMTSEQTMLVYNEWLNACEDAERHYNRMIELGATPQIARSVLNHSTKSEIVVTMNFREWRHFLKLRTAKDAHPSMREIAINLFREFKSIYPVMFSDMEEPNDD